jgi:hypothetical protein
LRSSMKALAKYRLFTVIRHHVMARARGVSALVNAVLQPALQMPRLRRLLAGACHSISDWTIALAHPIRLPKLS